MNGYFLLALLAAPGHGQDVPGVDSSARPQVVAERLAAAPRIDGVLEDDAWKGAPLALGQWLTYNPLNGDRLVQTTEVRVGYDERAIYFAFHCVDPEPDKVRSTLSRRDQLWNDDWVGFGPRCRRARASSSATPA